MRAFNYSSVFFFCAAILSWSLPVGAQQATESTTPPNLVKLEEGEIPVATNRITGSDTKITEKRERGHVTSIKVESGNSTYYVKPNTPHSSAYRDAQGNSNRAAQWQILEFDWGNRDREKSRRDAAAQAATTAPLPPTPLENR